MNDDDAKVAENLRRAEKAAGDYLSRHTAEYISDAIALIARLTAEVERLTPFIDAVATADAMSQQKTAGMEWKVSIALVGKGSNPINGTPISACYSVESGKACVAQGLLRDAGPILDVKGGG